MNLAALLVDHPFSDVEPLLHGVHESLTAGAARAESRAVADSLRAAGVQPGQGVAVQLPNGPGAITAMFGVWLAGAVLVPINVRSPERERRTRSMSRVPRSSSPQPVSKRPVRSLVRTRMMSRS